MNEAGDLQTIQGLSESQSGVFRLEDLRAALAEPHRAALYRRIDRLVEVGALVRFARGTYVAPTFDAQVLSQRLAPDSAMSFETVLADNLVIGPRPARRLSAIREGRSRTYEGAGWTLEHHRLDPSLRFGELVEDGVRRTVPEKALLDVLTFHQRGRRALFDVYSDVDLDRLDRGVLESFLERYRNPRFVAFARDVLQLP
ncbi:MAG: type IV toxin-antitoxin system AbiEi family antitoxin domain-containing protein [Planctomycetota bacterium]